MIIFLNGKSQNLVIFDLQVPVFTKFQKSKGNFFIEKNFFLNKDEQCSNAKIQQMDHKASFLGGFSMISSILKSQKIRILNNKQLQFIPILSCKRNEQNSKKQIDKIDLYILFFEKKNEVYSKKHIAKKDLQILFFTKKNNVCSKKHICKNDC